MSAEGSSRAARAGRASQRMFDLVARELEAKELRSKRQCNLRLARRHLSVLMSACALIALQEVSSGQCVHWSAAGLPQSGSEAYDMTVFDMGSGPQLFMADTPGFSGLGQISRWSGSGWVPVGGSFDDYAEHVYGCDWGAGPSIVTTGPFTSLQSTGQPMHYLARWNGSTWIDMNPPVGWFQGIDSACVFDDGSGPALYVGGEFASYGSLHSNNILRYDGSWHGVGGGLGLGVGALTVFDDGTGPALYACAGIHIGGSYSSNVVKWDGIAWTTVIAAGAPHVGIAGLTPYDDGSGPALIISGQFSSIAGVPANGLAKWDGVNLTALDGLPTGGFQRDVNAVAVHDDGSGPCLFVSYGTISNNFAGVMRWDGHAWIQIASAPIYYPMISFDDGLGAGPALWAGGYTFGGNLQSIAVARCYTACASPIDEMCFGDGTYAPCPCTNYGAVGHGCRNSANTAGALLAATGSPHPDTLHFTSSSELATSISLFLQGDSYRLSIGKIGDGIFCLGGQLRRLYVKTAANGTARAPTAGDLSVSAQSAALGDPLQPGDIRFYQVWYRDSASYCLSATDNVSNGIRVVW